MDILDTLFVKSFNTFGVLTKDLTIKVFVKPDSIISKTGNIYVTAGQVTEMFLDGEIDIVIWKKSNKLFKILEDHFKNKTQTN